MSFAIGYCRKTGQFYGLQNGTGRTVTDFFLSPNQQQSVPDERHALRGTLVTDESLCACPGCGQRTAGGCDCAEKNLPCEQNVGFRFYCIYCSRMSFYSAGTAGESFSGEEPAGGSANLPPSG